MGCLSSSDLGPILVRKAFLVPSSRGYLFEKFTRAEVEKNLNQMSKISLNPVYLCKQESRRIGTRSFGVWISGPVSSVILSESFKLSGENGLNDLFCSLNFQSYYCK